MTGGYVNADRMFISKVNYCTIIYCIISGGTVPLMDKCFVLNSKWPSFTDIPSFSLLAGSSVVLEQAENMPNGLYTVPLLVKDLQGLGEERTLNVRVCSCEREVNGVGECGARSASSSLGSWGILALVLSGLLLLLLCEFPLLYI